MLVVLPAPLTPTTIITVGVCSPTTRARSSDFNRSAMASISSAFTAAGSVALVSLTRRFRSASRASVAGSPASASSSADSSSSYNASSTWVPVKTCAMLEPVLRRPARRRSSQPARGAGPTGGAGSGVVKTGAASATGAGAAGTGDGAAGGFFLKKLNMRVWA